MSESGGVGAVARMMREVARDSTTGMVFTDAVEDWADRLDALSGGVSSGVPEGMLLLREIAEAASLDGFCGEMPEGLRNRLERWAGDTPQPKPEGTPHQVRGPVSTGSATANPDGSPSAVPVSGVPEVETVTLYECPSCGEIRRSYFEHRCDGTPWRKGIDYGPELRLSKGVRAVFVRAGSAVPLPGESEGERVTLIDAAFSGARDALRDGIPAREVLDELHAELVRAGSGVENPKRAIVGILMDHLAQLKSPPRGLPSLLERIADECLRVAGSGVPTTPEPTEEALQAACCEVRGGQSAPVMVAAIRRALAAAYAVQFGASAGTEER